MNTNRCRAALAALFLLFAFGPSFTATPAQADSVTFRIRSFAQKQVNVRFFSQNRNVHWPAGGKAWVLKDYKVHDLKLGCVAGEKICYGAWSGNLKWGQGPDGKTTGCRACCLTCNNNVGTVMDLNER